MSTTDTRTLSPAARARVEKAMRDLERAAFDPFRPYNPEPARAALTATVAALVAEAEARGREAAGLWRCECPMCLHHTEAHAINDPPPADFHGVTAPPHAAWCQSRFPMRGAPLPCNCAGQHTPAEGDDDV